MAVKKNIEDIQGKDNYPCGQQLLIHNGKVLKDETTLAENKVSEDGFLVVMLSKVYLFLRFTKPFLNNVSLYYYLSYTIPDLNGKKIALMFENSSNGGCIFNLSLCCILLVGQL